MAEPHSGEGQNLYRPSKCNIFTYTRGFVYGERLWLMNLIYVCQDEAMFIFLEKNIFILY